MPTVAFATLGCKVNQQETDAMRTLFEQAGYEAVPFESAADAYVINTCTVTQISDKKSRQMIARAHERNPQGVIAVVGCYAQRAPEEVKALPGVRLIIGTQHRDQIVELIARERASVVEDIRTARAFERLPVVTKGVRTRAQLKIQDGCDRFCSYCIIPYARGLVRSKPMDELQEELTALGKTGVGEAVLTGIHLMSYGKDLPGRPRLTDTIALAAAAPGIGRIRLGSLEPALIDGVFVNALASLPTEMLCPQFHLSMQSGSATVLARMNRRYSPEEYARAAGLLREAFPSCALTTDVIAGFPGETEEEHAQSMAFVEQMAFARIHVFPYSVRSGTKAAELPGQLMRAVKERRAHELIALGKKLEHAYLEAQLGTAQVVLAEESENGVCEGYAGNYIRVRFPGGEPGALTRVRITGLEDATALGEPI